jgi:hypothetical protein
MRRSETIITTFDVRLLQHRVNDVARRPGGLSISVHAQDKMAKLDLTFREVYSIFRDGVIDEDGRLQKTRQGEEFRFRIDRVIDSRPLAAIAVITPTDDSNIYVITVMEVVNR